MRRRKRAKLFSGRGSQVKVHNWLIRIGFVARIGAANIRAAHHRNAAHDNEAAFLLASARLARHNDGIRRQNAIMGLKRRLFGGIGLTVIKRFTQLQPRSGLNNFFHPAGIIHAGKLDQNLVVAQAVFLDQRLAHAQAVYALTDGFNRLLQRAVFQIGQHLRLHGQDPAILWLQQPLHIPASDRLQCRAPWRTHPAERP